MQIDHPWFLGNKISTTYKDYWGRIVLNSSLPVKSLSPHLDADVI